MHFIKIYIKKQVPNSDHKNKVKKKKNKKSLW